MVRWEINFSHWSVRAKYSLKAYMPIFLIIKFLFIYMLDPRCKKKKKKSE